MKLNNWLNSLLTYNPPQEYNFVLEPTLPDANQVSESDSSFQEPKNIYPSINVNLEYMKIKYNVLINSDIILREFTLNARGKQYNAFIVYIDGMIDSEIMDKFILEPLMLRNRNNLYDGSQNKVISEAVANNITVRKVKKFDLSNYVMGCLMPQNSIKQIKEFEEAINGINSRKLCFIYRYFRCCI